MPPKHDLIATIRALRARAADAASSAAEAEAAARRAAKLIAENEITEADLIERGAAGITEGTHNEGRRTQHPVLALVAFNIGVLSECTSLVREGENIWVGAPEDVEFAIYLCEMIEAAAERGYKQHWQRLYTRAPSARYRLSYMRGFAVEIASRMAILAKERRAAREAQSRAGSGTAIVALKDALIEDHLRATRPNLRTKRSGKYGKPDPIAFVNGHNDAQHVNVERPLGDQREATVGLEGGTA